MEPHNSMPYCPGKFNYCVINSTTLFKVQFRPKLSWVKCFKNIKIKYNKGLNILKTISNTSWVTVYKSLISSKLD